MPNIFDQFDQAPQAPRPGYMPVTGPDPRIPLDVAGKGLSNQKTAVDINRSQATLQPDIAKATADAARATAEAEKTRRELAGTAPPTPDKATEMRGDVVALDNLDRGVRQLQGYAEQNFYNQGLRTPTEYLPGAIRAENGVFDDTGNRLSAFIAKGLGLSGQQFNTPAEQRRFVDSYIPRHDDRDEVIASKIQALADLANNARGRLDAQLGYSSRRPEPDSAGPPSISVGPPGGSQPPAAPPQGGQPPAGGPPGGGAPVPPGYRLDTPPPTPLGLTKGKTRLEEDPAMRGVNNRVRYMLSKGRSAEDIVGYLNSVQPGYGDRAADQVRAVVDYRKRHPEVPVGRHRIDLQMMEVPMGTGAQLLNRVGQSPAGAAILAGGNAASLGTLADMTDNPARTRAAMSSIAESHPVANFIGSTTGGAAAVGGLEAALGRAGIARGAGMFAPRAMAADTLYGAGYGAGSSPDDRLGGALWGGVTGAGGGIAGRGVVGSTGSAVAPTGGGLADLYAAGVRPTIGQRFANTNAIGRGINRVEEAAQSVPLVGPVVTSARQQARDQFETGAFNQALGQIGGQLPQNIRHGTAAHAYMQRSFNNAYDRARSGMSFIPDQQFQAEGQAFFTRLGDGTLSREQAQRVTRIIDNVVASRVVRSGGRLNGDQYKLAISDLGKRARKLSSTDPLMSEALDDFTSIVDDAARRNSSPDAVALLDAADRGYAMAVRIEQAAAARGGDTGRFSPTQFDRSVQKASGGVRSRAYLRGDALMGDYAEQGKTLVDRLPNSGTADRAMVGAGLAGGAGAGVAAGLVSAPFLAKLGLLLTPYLPGARNVAGAAMAPRNSPIANRIGDIIRNSARIGGYVGAPAALAAYPPSGQ